MPDGFNLQFYCFELKDSGRYLIPVSFSSALTLELFTGGLAVVDHLKVLTSRQRLTYRMMSLIYQKVGRLQNYHGRRFQYKKDLQSADAGNHYNVLPNDLGSSSAKTGQPWGIPELMSEVKALAKGSKVTFQSYTDYIEYGLFAAAKLNPLPIENNADIKNLVRIATFDYVPISNCSDKMKEWIEEQILVAMEKHMKDSQEAFDNWFWGPNNSFLKQITKKKCSPEECTIEMVRGVLLKLGWDAYAYMAQCIHVQMKCFQNAIPEPLNGKEKKRFEMYYLQQECFGDFPLILLKDRIPFLWAPIESFLSGCNDFDFPGTIHQLLRYYSEMIETRREQDRIAQRRTVLKRDQIGNSQV